VRLVLAIASVLLLAAASSGKSANGNCSSPLPQGAPGLPAAVVVTTDCGLFRLERDGRVTYAGKRQSPVPPVARGYWPGNLAWYGLARKHLLIGRGMKRLWRSHDTYPGGRRLDVDGIAFGRRELAFSLLRGRQWVLFVARYGGREHEVASGEWPLDFAGDRLVTWRQQDKTLLLRTGGVARVLAHAIAPQVDPVSRMVVFRASGKLYAFDGARIRHLASLRKLGVTGSPTIDLLGHLVAVHDRKRLIVVGYDAALFASTALPKSRNLADGVSGPVVANADSSAVAYTVTSRNRLRETVYLLARGARRAVPLLAEKLDGEYGCGAFAWLAWQGQWLLYAGGVDQVAVLDISGQVPPRQLGDVIAKLPGIQTNGEGSFDVAWA
jgi:hypothetical protein